MISNREVHEIAQAQLDSIPQLPNQKQQEIVAGLVEQLKYSFILEILSDFAALKLRFDQMEAERNEAQVLIAETVTIFNIHPDASADAIEFDGRRYMNYGTKAPLLHRLYKAAGIPEDNDEDDD